MPILKLVAVSGSVGKQIYTSAKQAILKSITLTPSGANATFKLRDGQAPTSAEITYFVRAPSAHGSKQFIFKNGIKMTKGMHATVIGTNAQVYLELD